MVVLKDAPHAIPALLLEAYKLTRATFWSIFPYPLLATLSIALAYKMPLIGFSLLPALLIGYGIAMWLLSACVIHMHCLWSQTPCSLYQALRLALLKMLPLLLCLLIYAIVLVAGTMAMIVPALFLLFALALSFVLLLLQNPSLTQALLMSTKYVQQRWWHTFLTFGLPILLFTTLLMALFILEIRLTVFNRPYFKFVFDIATLIIQLWFIPLMISVAIILWHDLKSEVQGKRPV